MHQMGNALGSTFGWVLNAFSRREEGTPVNEERGPVISKDASVQSDGEESDGDVDDEDIKSLQKEIEAEKKRIKREKKKATLREELESLKAEDRVQKDANQEPPSAEKEETTKGDTEKTDIQELMREMKTNFEEGGAKALFQGCKENFDTWQSTQLNIAVTGRSGAGKSSFINAFRGLKHTDKGAAKVGQKQTTFEPTSYSHPDLELLKLWDLPGVGTREFKQSEYCEKVKLHDFDFYILVGCDRFTEDDEKIIGFIKDQGKQFYYVRTKLDQDLANKRLTSETPLSDVEIRNELREDNESELKACGVEKPVVFLVSSNDSHLGEMDKLKMRLFKDSYGLKKEVLLLTMTSFSMSLIKEKEEFLKKMVYRSALASGVAGFVPVPGVSAAVDVSLLLAQARYYKKAFGLDDKILQDIASQRGDTVESIKNGLQLQCLNLITRQGIITFLSNQTFQELSEDVVKYAIPGIGSVISGIMSFTTTYLSLRRFIEVFANDCRALCNYVHNKPSATSV